MCFSASASFGVSAVLLLTGISAVKKSQVRSQIPFAAIPLIFAFQQFSEGFVWLSLTNPSFIYWHQISMYVFLVVAQVIWPFWVPFSMFLIEKDIKKKKVLAVLVSMGLLVSFVLSYCLLFYEVHSSINRFHITYYLDFPKYHYITIISGIFYFMTTVLPAFVSSIKNMSLIGITLLLSYIVTKIFFQESVISVWCFFAAAISVLVFYIMVSIQDTNKENRIN